MERPEERPQFGPPDAKKLLALVDALDQNLPGIRNASLQLNCLPVQTRTLRAVTSSDGKFGVEIRTESPSTADNETDTADRVRFLADSRAREPWRARPVEISRAVYEPRLGGDFVIRLQPYETTEIDFDAIFEEAMGRMQENASMSANFVSGLRKATRSAAAKLLETFFPRAPEATL
jgi:hypothetical protein